MSDTIFDRIERRQRILQQQIEAEKKAAKPLTEAQFEKNEHTVSGGQVPATQQQDFNGTFPDLFLFYLDAINREAYRLDGVKS